MGFHSVAKLYLYLTHSTMIYSLGCDLAKDDFQVCLLRYALDEQTSQVVARKSFKNSRSGFKAFIRWTSRHSTGQPAPIRCTMEATGVYYEPLALYLADHHPEMHLSVVLPSSAKKYNASRGLRSKTDKIDAYGLALMGAERRLPAWGGIDRFWRTLRGLTRTRASLQKQITELNNQLHAHHHSGIQLPEVQQSLKRLIRQLRAEVTHLEELIRHHLASKPEYAYQIACLDSIPGVGLLTIAVILAETMGFEAFCSRSQLISFSGYDVVIQESGKWVGQPKISKQGSHYIRQAMYMPASAVVRSRKGPVWGLYQRLLSRHGVKMKAHVAVQKKLLSYMYFLWKKGEIYDPEKIVATQVLHQEKAAPPKGGATVDTSPALAL